MTTNNAQQTANNARREAAVRHAVFGDLLSLVPIASYDQSRQFVANLSLAGRLSGDAVARERQVNALLLRFINLRVTPDLKEATYYKWPDLAELERTFNRKYGELLALVPGFHRREPGAPFRLNLPFKCALYGYRSAARFYNGILCQPLDRLDTFFLLSSAKFGGPRALRLEPRDQQYFTQYEECRIDGPRTPSSACSHHG
jgi:hypothetical protein